MSEPFGRYLPLRDIATPRPEGFPGLNRTVAEREGLRPLYEAVRALEPAVAPVLIALAATVLLVLALMLLAGMWPGRELVGLARQYVLRRILKSSAGEEVEYVYPGIKAVLRKWYLRVRDSVGCRRCTPREIVTKCGRVEYEELVKLYEDVVYGSKELTPDRERILVSIDGSA